MILTDWNWLVHADYIWLISVAVNRLLFVGCILVGTVLFLVSLFHAKEGSGLMLSAHLSSMIGFGMGTRLAAGATGAVAIAMAVINGVCALAALLLRVEQDSSRKDSRL